MTSILELDAAGTPSRWIEPERATYYLTKGLVAWSLGEAAIVMRGGINARTGSQSTLALPPIMAIRGSVHASRHFKTPGVDRDALFRRDRYTCAYCGLVYRPAQLTADHVLPESRGGDWSWMNLVTACGGAGGCNGRKDDRTPEEAKMPLLYLPYVPSRHEHFILSGRRILADQMEFLLAGVPAHSRLRS